MEIHRRAPLANLVRPALTCGLLIALYYVIPIKPDVSGARLAVRTAVAVLLGLVIAWLIMRIAVRQASQPHGSLSTLFTALVGGVAFFALADYTVAVTAEGQFQGLATKTDGLYFALATLTTVGYGDVHAAGQVARGVVAVQMVFNVAVIATGASVLASQIGSRVRERAAR